MSEQGTGKTYTEADFNAQVERARNFEAKLTDTEKRLNEFKDVDPQAYKAIKEELNILKADKAASSKDPKAIEEEVKRREGEIRNGVQSELDRLSTELNTLRGRNKELEVVDKVFQSASGTFIDQAHDDVRDYIRRFCDKDEQGNIIVKDADGKPLYAKGSTTKLMGPTEFVEWLADKKPHWAKAKSKAGFEEKGTTTNGHSSGITPEKLLSMSDGERIAWGKANPKEFMELAPKMLAIRK